jgi:hypothetical protein
VLESLFEFWRHNTPQIIISVVVGLLFFVLGPLFSGKRIRNERLRKAKELLLDLLEEMIVNHAQIDETRLNSIYRAVERETDTVLTVTHTAQGLEVVCRRSAKSVEGPRGMYGHKLAHRCSLYVGRQLRGAYALEKLLRLFATEGPYHSKDNSAIG